MNKEKIHVTMLGCCVIRDAVDITENPDNDPDLEVDSAFEVDRYAQMQNPISAMNGKKILAEGTTIERSGVLDQKMFGNLAPFNKRNFTLDIERRLFDYIFQCRSEYLVIDMVMFRTGLFGFENGAYMTDEYVWYADAIDELKEKGYINMDYRRIDAEEEIVPLIKNAIYPYLNKLLEYYPADRIILVEVKPVEYYIDNGVLKTFRLDTTNRRHSRATLAFNIAREYLKGCHVVEFPDYVVSDKEHKWGLSSSHYSREYYAYLYDAYDVIMRGNYDRETERAKLDALRDLCSEEYYEMCRPLMFNSIKRIQAKAETAERCTSYCDCYEAMLEKTDAAEFLGAFMKAHGYESCAFFGYTRITKVLINIMRKNGIAIDYILENSKKTEIDGIPIYRRTTLKRPETDVIIVSDMSDTEVIKEWLIKTTDIPVVDVYDMIK